MGDPAARSREVAAVGLYVGLEGVGETPAASTIAMPDGCPSLAFAIAADAIAKGFVANLARR